MRVTVTSGASTQLAANSTSPRTDRNDDYAARSFLVKNRTRTASVYLEVSGAADGAASFEWEATDGALPITLEPGEMLNGRSAGDDQVVHILGAGR